MKSKESAVFVVVTFLLSNEENLNGSVVLHVAFALPDRFDNAGISTPHRSLSEVGPKSAGDAAVTRAIEMRATLRKRMIM